MNSVQVLTAEWTLSMGMDAGSINVIVIQTRVAFWNPNPIDERPWKIVRMKHTHFGDSNLKCNARPNVCSLFSWLWTLNIIHDRMRMQDSPIFGILRNLFLYFNPLLHSNWSSIVFALGSSSYASSFPLPFTRERSSHRAYIALHCVRKHQAKWMNKKKRNKSAILPHIRFASKMTRRMNLSLRNCSHQKKLFTTEKGRVVAALWAHKWKPSASDAQETEWSDDASGV